MEQTVSSGLNDTCETETQATFRSHEYILCQINTNATKLVHSGLLLSRDWWLTLPVWHFDAV